ncbi:regulatory protein RecX [Arcanobacterium canis]|uniref:Regulatory protein RecX n=1 Tax=Arcanobacterium canis TaxID=999183 RepID=A0ABY8G0U9_9ACTO|nr:regulatory protein RecX [Arcanobacterium canis]WFM82826.1 regulatory protein RecX [Arcanobacterium canis]
MVNYSEDADVRPRKRSNPREIEQRKQARAAARSASEWRSFARDIVYRRLAVQDRSSAELRMAMERELVPQEFIDETLKKFSDADLVNDERFAQSYVRSRFESKSTSRRSLTHDLRQKGIIGELADQALSQISDSDEQASANAFAIRRIRSMTSLDAHVIRRRLFGALARRGFSPTQALCAIDSAFDAVESDPDDHR